MLPCLPAALCSEIQTYAGEVFTRSGINLRLRTK